MNKIFSRPGKILSCLNIQAKGYFVVSVTSKDSVVHDKLQSSVCSNAHSLHSLSHILMKGLGATVLLYSTHGQKCMYSLRRKDYNFPELKAEDLEETFVRGSGPGGQAVNKTTNCVVLKHKPTGIVVKCHMTRSLQENQKHARKILEEKLDFELHGDRSYLGQQRAEIRDDKLEKKRRAKERLARKMAFKNGEGLQ